MVLWGWVGLAVANPQAPRLAGKASESQKCVCSTERQAACPGAGRPNCQGVDGRASVLTPPGLKRTALAHV